MDEAPASAAAPAPAPAPSAQPEPDPLLLAQLTSMGFSENGCRRALAATGGGSMEAALEWVLVHMEDANFNDPPGRQGYGFVPLGFSMTRPGRQGSRVLGF